jgi:hypothetical protein
MRTASLCFLLLSLSATAFAAPNVAIFGGYQYTRLGDSTVTIIGGNPFGGPAINGNGWTAALTGGFNSWLGIRADVGASYPTNFNFYTYTFGPELTAHLPIVRPFAHALFGIARLSAFGVGQNSFETMLGGGVDVGHGILAWRLAQFDWMSKGIANHNNFRVCTGLVLRF